MVDGRGLDKELLRRRMLLEIKEIRFAYQSLLGRQRPLGKCHRGLYLCHLPHLGKQQLLDKCHRGLYLCQLLPHLPLVLGGVVQLRKEALKLSARSPARERVAVNRIKGDSDPSVNIYFMGLAPKIKVKMRISRYALKNT